MIISGRGSSRDIEQALTIIKQQWEQTHVEGKETRLPPSVENPKQDGPRWRDQQSSG